MPSSGTKASDKDDKGDASKSPHPINIYCAALVRRFQEDMTKAGSSEYVKLSIEMLTDPGISGHSLGPFAFTFVEHITSLAARVMVST